jgi:quercetin dioxygenase-like cupin family protein
MREPDNGTPDRGAKVVAFPKFVRPTAHVILWESRRRPDEVELRARLAADGYGVVGWRNEPATGYPPHAHIYPELLWLVSGNLTIILPVEKRLLELAPGDRVEVPQGVVHGTMAGPEGAVYLLATR